MWSNGYVVIEESEDCIVSHGFFDSYYAAVGKAVCIVTDDEDEWERNGYETIEKDDFFLLETGEGFGWSRKYRHKEKDITVYTRFCILETKVNPLPEEK